jgi:regulator of replication initiation timing
MICEECARALGLLGQGAAEHSKCDWCGRWTRCHDRALQQQSDPRRAIRDRLRAIKARQVQLQEYVDEHHALTLERLALRERYSKLERHLRRVPVRVISVKEANAQRFKVERERARQKLVSQLSDAGRAALIAALEAALAGKDE